MKAEEKTTRIQWSEQYSVGVKILDEQHKNILRLLNRIQAHADAPSDSEEISELLTQMTNYANEHFRTEEDLMQMYDYPDFSSHRREHLLYWKKTAELAMDILHGKTAISLEMLSFLRQWWTHHVLKVDKKYKTFFEEKGIA